MNAPIQNWIRVSSPCRGGFHIPGEIIGTELALLKFKQFTVCEVLGYQLAHALRVDVPRMKPIWSNQEVFCQHGETALPYRVGIVIQWLDAMKRCSEEDVAHRYPSECSRALTLCAFNRYEWAEFAEADDKFFAIDLERIMPAYIPELLIQQETRDQEGYIQMYEEDYSREGLREIDQVLRTATELGLLQPVRSFVRQLIGNPDSIDENTFRLDGHPLGRRICDSAKRAARTRLSQIAHAIELPWNQEYNHS